MPRSPVTVERLMRLAIPTWNDRVSPVFDTASRLVLVDVEQGAEQGRRIVEAGTGEIVRQSSAGDYLLCLN